MQRDGLPRGPRPRRDARQRRRPPVAGVEDAAGRDGETLGREAEAADVRDGDEPLADVLELLRVEVVRVAARDDDVLQLRGRFDVLEDFLPAAACGLEGGLGDGVGVGTDGVGAGAEGAVGGADGGCWVLMVSV